MNALIKSRSRTLRANDMIPSAGARRPVSSLSLADCQSCGAFIAAVLALGLLLVPLQRTEAHQDPPGCAGNISSSGIGVLQRKAHIGDTVNITVQNFGVPQGGCTASDVVGRIFPGNGAPIFFVTNALFQGSTPTNPPGGMGDVINCPGPDPRCLPGPMNGYPYTIQPGDETGEVLNPIGCPFIQSNPGGAHRVVYFFVVGSGVDHASGAGELTFSACNSDAIEILNPCISCTKFCTNGIGENGAITFGGSVINCGNTRLFNVSVSNFVNGGFQLVTNISVLETNQAVTFSGSYVPVDPCRPATDTIFVRGTDELGLTVTNSCTQTCSNLLTAGITVRKICPPGPVQPGQPLVFSSVVSNSGNVTLTNVVIINDQPTNNAPVFGPITLAPGQSTNFTGSYVVPLDSCGPYTDTLTARGTSVCGVAVTNTDTKVCPGTNAPAIQVTKSCPAEPVGQGGLLSFSGVVSNTGNITLTNVLVFNNRPTNGTPVFGPVTLLPGQATNFSGSYLAPTDACSVSDTLTAVGQDKCFGVAVTNTSTRTCVLVTVPAISVTKFCPVDPVGQGGLLTFSGVVSNSGNITLTNVVVFNNRPTNGTPVFGPVTLLPGQSANFTGSYLAPADACAVSDTLTAVGQDKCTGASVTNSSTRTCVLVTAPAISVTKFCPISPVGQGGLLTFSGVVSNAGNITLTNVVVFNNRPTNYTPVFGPITLGPGQATNFSGSYFAPTDACSVSDTLMAVGQDKCTGASVTNSSTRTCVLVTVPAISVTKSCPPGSIQPGGVLNFTGSVTNTGDITLTNVFVVNDKPVANTVLIGPLTLAPGAGTNFTGSYVVPLDSCGPYVDTLVASGRDKCSGVGVTNSATAMCPGTNSPLIRVTKRCATVPTAPGEITTFSGTVSNAGNITLTNVIVVNDQPEPNTLVLGPITLAPGQSMNFSDSYRIPLNCCTHVDTLRATGADKCFGRVVSHTATAVCPTLTTPRITVTKHCPGLPVPLGQPLVFSGVVSNAGNITLTNVTVVNNQPSNNTPVLGPMTLAPGETAVFVGSYPVPMDICETNLEDTVTARGQNLCSGGVVTDSATASCPIIATPRLRLFKYCPPNPVPPGGVLVFSGTVSNSGNVTVTNIIVVNDQPTNDTPVFGPVTLRPGESANFSGNYLVHDDCCPPYVDTLTARGNSVCTGSNVTATATAYCPGITTPRIVVTKSCPLSPVPQGQPLVFSGIVSNAGNVVLQNVTVTDDRAGLIAAIPALAPGEWFDYTAAYVPTNCGPNVASTVVALAADACTGTAVSNNFTAGCNVLCAPLQPITILNPRVERDGFVFSFFADLNRNYTVEFTPSLFPVNWQMLTNFPGAGTTVDIRDGHGEAQRFYRVFCQ